MTFGSPRFYPVRPEAVLDLPEGRTRSILARKTVAGFLKFSNTRSLAANGLDTDEKVLDSLESIVASSVVFSAPEGFEPRDPTDRSRNAVSLETFMRRHQANISVFVDQVARQVAEHVEDELYEDAYMLLTDVMDDLPLEFVGRLVPSMESLAPHHPEARACLAKILLEEDHLDFPRALAILEEVVEGTDARAIGLASIWLGGIYEAQPFGARKALRTYEHGALHEEGYCAFKAGVLCEKGGEGLPVDFERAARNYRWGVEDGDDGCMINLGLMLARRDVEPLPGEDWRFLLKAGAYENDVGRAYISMIDGIEREIGKGNPMALAERLRTVSLPERQPSNPVESAIADLCRE